MKNKFLLLSVCTELLLSGCVSKPIKDKVDVQTAQAIDQADFYLKKANPVKSRQERERDQEVNLAYIAGRSVPLARSVALPRALQKGVKTAVLFPDSRISLAAAAERIMLATNIMVSIAPDVFIDDSMLLPKNLSSQSSKQTANAPLPIGTAQTLPVNGSQPLPQLSAGTDFANPSSVTKKEVDTPYSFDFPRIEAPLSQILDLITVRLGIRWKYDDSTNTIKFYRFVTKTWETPFTSAMGSYSTSFDASAGGSTNSNVISQKPGASPVKNESRDVNELTSLVESLNALVTKSGVVIPNKASGTITITDTADVIDSADAIIKAEIGNASREVTFKVQTVQVTTNNSVENSLDITAIANAALQNLPNLNVTSSPAATLTNTNAASIGVNVLSGKATGSAVVVKALKDYGKVFTSQEVPLRAKNRKAIYYNITNTFSYVSSTTPGTASLAGGGGTPGISTAQDQVGLKMMLYPKISTSDNVDLTFAIDQSALQNLVVFTSGSGSTMQSVQLPNKSANGLTLQEVSIRNGSTLILAGFEKKTHQYDQRTLGDGVPGILGGSSIASEENVITLVLVSAAISDNGRVK
ncbi:hypothetical protein [Undibacterium oligocarboniphilum]|uniref:Type IVB pilus formation outer membrane protein, R64 PilN family n=1 Tax=Undibacterium oligocarboniphilum TaxID=666702 RepID=A0A850QET5_9BURK|nr:hypothetical protein [Undibacterium oligocarboniphilum]MBC3871442.1 hypothetical protein [Undibacterium oligocarboniphilum]NVO78982.1 hypothetical protein [Undibacterium oligocarboniphilum]